ncbi:MAG: chemotaxis protein CheW, partial [Halobacteriota archaeon]|nr:chemotaxis protein CheW [Halobacteriota archaeon]
DSVIGQQEVVIKSLDKLLQNVKGFAGATILGDGRVILILDITTLF